VVGHWRHEVEEANANPEDVRRAQQTILRAFQRDLEALLRERGDVRAKESDDRTIFGLADKAVRDYLAMAAASTEPPHLSRPQLLEIRRWLYVTHSALGPLGELLAIEGVEDIHINGTRGGYIEFGDHREPLPIEYRSEEELERSIRWYAEQSGKHFDPGNPIVTVTLRDGSRINAILPPVARPMVITIRRQQVQRFLDLEDLLREGTIPEAAIPFLQAAVVARLNIVLAGPTGSGKTTFGRVLALLIPKGERTCVLETECELWLHDLREEDFFSLEERDANVEGAGRITLRDLFQRGALRQRPRRIIVGEVRGDEALEMLHAMTSGHDGSLTTVHASGPRIALHRLQMLAMSADPHLAPEVIAQMVGTGVDLIVQLGIFQRGQRSARKLAAVGFVDHNLESPAFGPVFQEVCRYRVETDDWDWDMDALRYLPGKIGAKFRAADVDDRRLRVRVMGSDGN
jgi:pilus assembly protein CpaF